jgi:hypothetical protein
MHISDLSHLGSGGRGCWLEISLGKVDMRTYLKNKTKSGRTEGMVYVVECLLRKCKP